VEILVAGEADFVFWHHQIESREITLRLGRATVRDDGHKVRIAHLVEGFSFRKRMRLDLRLS